MKLESVACREEQGQIRLVGSVRRGDGSRCELYFSYEAIHRGLVTERADAFLAALLLPAMAAGEPLEIEPPVSPLLLRRAPRLQAIFSSWFPHYRPVAVHAHPRDLAADVRGGGVGAFFSGGVDAFYTLLKSVRGWPGETPPITHALFFHGLETTLEARRGAAASEARARAVAKESGILCVAGETNLRSCFPLVWGEYCGAGLAAAGLSLADGLGYVLIPSTDSYADCVPWGSHPLVDELWSTESTTLLSDGAEAPRAAKIERLLANDPLARQHLRVCVHNDGGDFNCGHCYKCVRTMLALRALGVEEHFETLPRALPGDLERQLAEDHEIYLRQNLALLERSGRDPEIAATIRRVLRARLRRSALRQWLESSAVAPLLPAVRALRARTARSTGS